MTNICEKLDIAMRDELRDILADVTAKTLETFFGCKITATENAQIDYHRSIVACVILRQGIEAVTLRLIFDYSFINKLVVGFYGNSNRSGDEELAMCEDAVSEMANIISNKVKYFMNNNGFSFYIDTPYIEKNIDDHENSIINLNFTISDSDVSENSLVCVNL